jgi:tetratricopeptide (TPR) repeat protein
MRKAPLTVLASTLVASLSFPSTALAGDMQGTAQRVNSSHEPAAEGAEASTTEEAPAEATASDEARAAYKAGKTAFRLGRFEEAIPKFEEAYALSGNAAVLFNIALAYERLGENKKDVQALRNAKTAYQNYLGEIRKNDLLDPDAARETTEKIEGTIARIDGQIEVLEAESEAARNAAEGPETGAAQVPDDREERRAALMKKSKLWLGAGAGAGGVLLAAGAALTVVFGQQGKKASDALAEDFDAYNANNCGTASQMGTSCQDTYNDIQDHKTEGDRANTMLFAVGLPVTVVGAAVLGAGVGMGLKFRKQAGALGEETPSVSVLPSLGGLVLQGRF